MHPSLSTLWTRFTSASEASITALWTQSLVTEQVNFLSLALWTFFPNTGVTAGATTLTETFVAHQFTPQTTIRARRVPFVDSISPGYAAIPTIATGTRIGPMITLYTRRIKVNGIHCNAYLHVAICDYQDVVMCKPPVATLTFLLSATKLNYIAKGMSAKSSFPHPFLNMICE